MPASDLNCHNNNQEYVTCVHVPGIMTLDLFKGEATELPTAHGALLWNDPWKQKIIAILAHNYLDGELFYNLSPHQKIYLIWSSGRQESYQIEEIHKWKNVNNWRLFSPLDGGETLTDIQLHQLYYKGGANFEKLILQTCIGDMEGVIFFVAYRILTPSE